MLDCDQLHAALDAGAEFYVSPGLTESLGRAAAKAGLRFLRRGQCRRRHARPRPRLLASQILSAAAAGGLPALKALSAVFGDVRFCPTGGITEASAPDWLLLPAVACVGGSWLVPAGEPIDPAPIRRRAQAAAALPRG